MKFLYKPTPIDKRLIFPGRFPRKKNSTIRLICQCEYLGHSSGTSVIKIERLFANRVQVLNGMGSEYKKSVFVLSMTIPHVPNPLPGESKIMFLDSHPDMVLFRGRNRGIHSDDFSLFSCVKCKSPYAAASMSFSINV